MLLSSISENVSNSERLTMLDNAPYASCKKSRRFVELMDSLTTTSVSVPAKELVRNIPLENALKKTKNSVILTVQEFLRNSVGLMEELMRMDATGGVLELSLLASVSVDLIDFTQTIIFLFL